MSAPPGAPFGPADGHPPGGPGYEHPPRGPADGHPPGPPCPVCGWPVPGTGPCPTCGLPAAAQAGYVLARIDRTLGEFARDRDALLASFRAAALGASAGAATQRVAAPAAPWGHAPVPAGAASPPAAPPVSGPPPGLVGRPSPVPGRPRLRPQQVLLGLGALLLVAGAAAFVALGWNRLGLAFQAAVMLTVTASACGISAWVARRRLRATEEALAASGAALLAVDLAAAHAKGLLGADRIELRPWAAVACAVLLVVAVALGRLTRTTLTWPLAALLAGQPIALLLLRADQVEGPWGVAALLALAAADAGAARLLRPSLSPVALTFGGFAATAGGLLGLTVAYGTSPGRSWAASATVVAAAAGAVLLTRLPSSRPQLPHRGAGAEPVAAAAAVVGLVLAGSLRTAGEAGLIAGAWAGLALLTAAAVLRRPVGTAALLATGFPLTLVTVFFLIDADLPLAAALACLGGTVPSALWSIRRIREGRQIGPPLAPAALAVVLAGTQQLFSFPVAGVLLALLSAVGFGLAALRSGHRQEPVLAGEAALIGLLAAAFPAVGAAWGQLGLDLALVGAAAGVYALAARRRWVGVLAVADVVIACWVAVAGAGVRTPEAYSLPAAAGLLLVALPAIRAGRPSWAAEGAAVAVALVPSAAVVVAAPTGLRLVLVVAGAVAVTGLGTRRHRQAPFVLGSGTLAFVVVGRLFPYAPLLPRWITLTAAGLVLLVLGATYERRLAQARELVAWVGHMR